jgi:hypothetical protein
LWATPVTYKKKEEGEEKKKKKVGCGDGDKNVKLHGTMVIGSKLVHLPPPPNYQVWQVGRLMRSRGSLG